MAQLCETSLFDLPVDDILFERILPQLTVTQLWRCRLVCTWFHAVIERYLECCHSVDWSVDIPVHLNERVFRLVMAKSQHLISLCVHGCRECFTDQSLDMITANNAALKRVDFGHCTQLTPRSLLTLLNANRQLQCIDFSGIRSVSAAVCQGIALWCPRLAVLKLDGAWDVDSRCVVTISAACPNLRRLSLQNCYAVNNDGLFEAAPRWKQLTSLDIRGCWRVSNDGVMSLTQHCRELRELFVAGCRDISESSLFALRRRQVRIDVELPRGLHVGARDIYRKLAFVQV
ncbi:F-box/LRR-repeat protein 15-like [Sycon ciliatum]|uniref:F-box/LRR-repeat protein 15-like n=1 Tax=Sycon ciliatum TaxID=27933 RepID=UPI0031F66E37